MKLDARLLREAEMYAETSEWVSQDLKRHLNHLEEYEDGDGEAYLRSIEASILDDLDTMIENARRMSRQLKKAAKEG